jgi:hypothetical protein
MTRGRRETLVATALLAAIAGAVAAQVLTAPSPMNPAPGPVIHAQLMPEHPAVRPGTRPGVVVRKP